MEIGGRRVVNTRRSASLPALGSLKDGFGFLVLCPQGQSGAWAPTGDDARRAMELLAKVEEEYRVDTKRIYLTGVSSGGTGVWDLAAQGPVPLGRDRPRGFERRPCWPPRSRTSRAGAFTTAMTRAAPWRTRG